MNRFTPGSERHEVVAAYAPADVPDLKRFEVALLVGPCLESEAEELLLAVVEFARQHKSWAGNALGPVGSVCPWTEDK